MVISQAILNQTNVPCIRGINMPLTLPLLLFTLNSQNSTSQHSECDQSLLPIGLCPSPSELSPAKTFPLPSSSISEFSLPSHFPSFSKLDSYDSSLDDFIHKYEFPYQVPPMIFDDGMPSPILPPVDKSSFQNFIFPELEWDHPSLETEVRHRLPQQK